MGLGGIRRGWVRLAKSDPSAAIEAARPALDDADADVAAMARWATGRALFELARNDEAIAMLRSAAGRVDDPAIRQEIEVSLAAAVGSSGDTPAARELLGRVAAAPADAVIGALATSQEALLDLGAGDVEAARRRLHAAIPVLVGSAGHRDAAARALGNLGYCDMVSGDLAAAVDSFERAGELGADSGEQMVVIGCRQNLGYVRMLQGDLPAALAALDAARVAYERIDSPSRNLSTLFHDLAEVNRVAGLGPESVIAAATALELVEGTANVERTAEARFQLAQCLLDAGRPAEARAAAGRAEREFAAAGRSLWAHRSALIELTSTEGPLDDALVERATRAIAESAASGWPGLAVRLSNQLAHAAWRNGAEDADRFLALAPAPSADRSIVLDELEAAFHDTLEAAVGGADVGPAMARARAIVDRHRHRLADPELRARAGRLGERFRTVGLGDAIRRSDAAAALAREEMWRSHAPAAIRPPVDAAVAAAATELRRFVAEHPDHAERADEAAAVRALEEELRRRSMRSVGTDRVITARRLELDDLGRALGGRELSVLLRLGADLWAIRALGGELSMSLVGPVGEIVDGAARLRTRLARLMRPGLSEPRAERRWEELLDDAADLGRRFGVRDTGATSDLVAAPIPELRALPWTLLTDPGRAVTVTPSASVWLAGAGPVAVGSAAAVIGPRLRYGGEDVAAVGAVGAPLVVATGEQATSEVLRRFAESVDLLHVAAHGRLRADSPWFSALDLADGPFTLYELGHVDAPALVTLAACDTARSLGDGAELTGVAPAWLAAGSRRVLAPVCAVPDASVGPFVWRYYRALAGSTPEAALRAAADPDAAVVDRATAAAFVSYGAEVGRVSLDAPAALDRYDDHRRSRTVATGDH